MQREKKKRMMPRHMLTAAVLNGIIPRSKISDSMLSKERLDELDRLIKERKAQAQSQRAQLAANKARRKATGAGRGRPRGVTGAY